jgi:hypothetical protein
MCTLASMYSSSYAFNSCDVHDLGSKKKTLGKICYNFYVVFVDVSKFLIIDFEKCSIFFIE